MVAMHIPVVDLVPSAGQLMQDIAVSSKHGPKLPVVQVHVGASKHVQLASARLNPISSFFRQASAPALVTPTSASPCSPVSAPPALRIHSDLPTDPIRQAEHVDPNSAHASSETGRIVDGREGAAHDHALGAPGTRTTVVRRLVLDDPLVTKGHASTGSAQATATEAGGNDYSCTRLRTEAPPPRVCRATSQISGWPDEDAAGRSAGPETRYPPLASGHQEKACARTDACSGPCLGEIHNREEILQTGVSQQDVVSIDMLSVLRGAQDGLLSPPDLSLLAASLQAAIALRARLR
jgi:hypothetical protein